MRILRWAGVMVVAWCGCAATGDRHVDITAPQANVTRRAGETAAAGESLPDAPATPAQSKRYALIRVYYGTDRARRSDDAGSSPQELYSHASGPLEFGVCQVGVPEPQGPAEHGQPHIWRFEVSRQTDERVVLRSVEPLDRETCLGRLQADVRESATGEALIFVHGSGVGFADAVRRTAVIAHALQFDGPPVLYSWPTGAESFNDMADRIAAGRSETHFARFVEAVAEQSGATGVHVVAHHLGSQLVAGGLQRSADRRRSPTIRLDQAILIEPGVEEEMASHRLAASISDLVARVTVYASDGLGEVRGAHSDSSGTVAGIPEAAGVDLIDVSASHFEFLHASSPASGNELLADIRQVLTGAAATQRGLQPHPQRRLAWRLPAPQTRVASHAEATGDYQPITVERADPDDKRGATASLWDRLLTWWPR